MRVLMLGWEFPPIISGGVGTACAGLTQALSRSGTEVIFVLPRHVDPGSASPVRLIGVASQMPRISQAATAPSNGSSNQEVPGDGHRRDESAWQPSPGEAALRPAPLRFITIAARLDPYARPNPAGPSVYEWVGNEPADSGIGSSAPQIHVEGAPAGSRGPAVRRPVPPPPPPVDLFAEVDRYAHLATQAVIGQDFDVIHAHDWMTFPAAMAIESMTGKPFIAHVHSTEFDRSGHHIDQRIYETERSGMERAAAVIAVSFMTRGIITSRYGVGRDKIAVVYNAINGHDLEADSAPAPAPIGRDEKIVLFLGRITLQKGPEYFLAAARKVLQVYDNVRFVMAGAGDMTRRTIELATEMGIGDKVLFTGFLNGPDVERIFRSADLYVMPSVSEPFGIASLEAISYDVPVLLSKQSGAAEVLRHVLKVDFWDIEEMANKIVAVLRHPPLHAMLKTKASYEVRRLSWGDSAQRCTSLYEAVAAMASSRKASAVDSTESEQELTAQTTAHQRVEPV